MSTFRELSSIISLALKCNWWNFYFTRLTQYSFYRVQYPSTSPKVSVASIFVTLHLLYFEHSEYNLIKMIWMIIQQVHECIIPTSLESVLWPGSMLLPVIVITWHLETCGQKEATLDTKAARATVRVEKNKMYSFERSVTKCVFMTHKMIKFGQQVSLINN